jgi:hypothetical protein
VDAQDIVESHNETPFRSTGRNKEMSAIAVPDQIMAYLSVVWFRATGAEQAICRDVDGANSHRTKFRRILPLAQALHFGSHVAADLAVIAERNTYDPPP